MYIPKYLQRGSPHTLELSRTHLKLTPLAQKQYARHRFAICRILSNRARKMVSQMGLPLVNSSCLCKHQLPNVPTLELSDVTRALTFERVTHFWRHRHTSPHSLRACFTQPDQELPCAQRNVRGPGGIGATGTALHYTYLPSVKKHTVGKEYCGVGPMHKFTQDTSTEPAGAWNREQESRHYRHRSDLFSSSKCEALGKTTEGD